MKQMLDKAGQRSLIFFIIFKDNAKSLCLLSGKGCVCIFLR
jgi:hypothetical protein